MVTKSTDVCELAIAQPELPDVGVGHRHLDPRLHAADRLGQHRRRHLAAQQHLVADDDRAHDVRKPVRQRNAGADLILRAVGMARHPKPEQHFQAMPLRDLGNLVEAEIDRIGANAIGHLRQLRQVLLDLRGLDFGREIERRLRAAERRIGDAIELLAGSERRRRHRHRRTEPPPRRDDDRGRQSEQTDRFMHPVRPRDCRAYLQQLPAPLTRCDTLIKSTSGAGQRLQVWQSPSSTVRAAQAANRTQSVFR